MVARRQQGGASAPLNRTSPFVIVLAVLALVLFLFPPFWMLLASLKTQLQNIAIPPLLLFKPTLENFRTAFVENPFGLYFLNSLFVAAASTILGLIFGAPAAYGVARLHRQGLALAVLTARILPGISYLVPWFIIFNRLGWIGSYQSLILAHLTVGLPVIMWMLIGAFEDLPADLEDSALIDGSSVFGTFWRVALPLTVPVAISASIIAFIFSWNNFLFSLVLAGPDTQPLPVAVFKFLSYGNINWGALAAAAFIVTAPMMILALIAQRYVVSGMTMGAVKG